ncbi:hypothetical protein [Enterococcus phage EFLK1]|uniref:Uncharacterized protein n=1 Tax=Enterococcus phage EFLK1 TaxID=1640885 RepID=A0A0E3TA46_9CAUD|nr:hypothetical protein AVT53_gp154 [Enterococcus phage EFLK1]AKC05025.1 hypothetical protein [Enterococcus phage EFLK1]
MDTVTDIINVLGIIKQDIEYKEERIKELEGQGKQERAELLKAEVKGMREVVQDVEQAL